MKMKLKKSAKGNSEISTASLPDIIFMLLFFFMVTTTMRDAKLLVKVIPPDATEVQRLEKKSLVEYIYIGPPVNKKYGDETRIQINDQFISGLHEISEWATTIIINRPEDERKFLTTSLKVHKDTKMGIVTDIKQELRKANALKINYSTRKNLANK